MKICTCLILAMTIGLAGCGEKRQSAPAPNDEMPSQAATPQAETTVAPQADALGTAAFLEHMHHHASQLGQLNAALDVGSLAAAQRPAYWLAGHDEVSGVPEGWQGYLDGMREAAQAVEGTEDIAAARAAAARIEENCHGCHTAAGAEVPRLQLD